MNYAVVSTKKELEQALERKVDKIIVTDPDLARNIRTVKSASKVALTAAIGAVTVAATNFWNPVGLGAGLFGAVASGSIITAIILLGLGMALVWVIYNEYKIVVKGKVKMPDGTVIEGEIVLEKN
jgi:predicted phage tail protein